MTLIERSRSRNGNEIGNGNGGFGFISTRIASALLSMLLSMLQCKAQPPRHAQPRQTQFLFTQFTLHSRIKLFFLTD
jgi:hypothetical protein